jgi:thioredoxin 1
MLSTKKSRSLALLLVTLFLNVSCNQHKSSEKDIVLLTRDNFALTTNKGLVLVDYWATWCKPCQLQGPIVAGIAEQFKGKLTVGKCDIDQNRELANTYNIQSIPTLILFKDGLPVETLVGLQSKGSLEEVIGKYLKK